MKTLKILVFMMFVMVSMGFGQEYSGNDYNVNGEYAEYDDENLSYDYGYDNARDYLERYNGPVYYWGHPQRDVYFVLVGRRVFVIPMYELSSIWNRLHWSLVSMDRFIHLSSFGLPYYDNYMRFNYYFGHYQRYGYGSYYNRYLRTHYRRYYRNRRNDRSYYRNRSRVLRNSRYRSSIPRRKIIRERLDTRKRAIRNSPATRRYTSRRTTRSRTYGSTGSSSRSRINNSNRRVIRRDSVRRSTSKRSTSVRRPARRSTSSRSVRRSRSSRRSSRNSSSTKSRSKSRRR